MDVIVEGVQHTNLKRHKRATSDTINVQITTSAQNAASNAEGWHNRTLHEEEKKQQSPQKHLNVHSPKQLVLSGATTDCGNKKQVLKKSKIVSEKKVQPISATQLSYFKQAKELAKTKGRVNYHNITIKSQDRQNGQKSPSHAAPQKPNNS